MAQATLKRTPFHDIHAALGAKLVPFAGYEMPVQYPTGITAEHRAVREACGVFDVSHMGEFIVRGSQAVDFVNYVTTNDVAKLAEGQVHYSTILNERGTIEDDCLVYRYADDHLMMVVNGSNKDKDLAHVLRYKDRFDCTVEARRVFGATPTPFDPELIGLARRALVEAGGEDGESIPSGPLHDATEIGRLVPTVMLFAQSDPPLSHTAIEDSPEAALRLAIDAYGRTAGAALDAVAAGDLEPAAR